MRPTLVAALLFTLIASAAEQPLEPFVPVGVGYEAGTLPTLAVLRDLHTIRGLGFNHVRSAVPWGKIEAERGTYRFETVDQLLTLADESGLRVILDLVTDPSPPWRGTEPLDPSLVAAFAAAVTSRAAVHRSFYGIDAPGRPNRASVHPRPASAPPWSAAQLGWRLDAARSAAGDKGWRVTDVQSSGGGASAVSGADLRLWGWTAIARGARAITYASWRSGSRGAGMVDADGAVNERARMAGEFAGVVSRNAALFAPLRTTPSRVAIVYNPASDLALGTDAAVASSAATEIYQRLFERNIQADIIPPEEILVGGAAKYAVVFLGFSPMPQPILDALQTYAQKGGTVVSDARAGLPEHPAIQPDVRIEGGGGQVEARFLESSDALLFVAINHAQTPQTITFTFTPETPEAIWQNMETGASVSFVQSPAGVTHKHAFAARDVVVLMIRKRLR